MKYIRVGVTNNFNFTDAECDALQHYESKGKLFVNSNSFVTINSKYPSIITLNPYMHFVEPKGDISNVKAFRLKYVRTDDPDVGREQEAVFDFIRSVNIPLLVTLFRFKSNKTLCKYVPNVLYREHYRWDGNWYRPDAYVKEHAFKCLKERLGDLARFCDWEGKGCLACGNCIRLCGGDPVKDEVVSLNLSCSGNAGKCIFDCPDCWAKLMLKMTKNKQPKLDVLHKNRKQKGLVVHK